MPPTAWPPRAAVSWSAPQPTMPPRNRWCSTFTNDRPCKSKDNHPPGPAALAAAARLLGPGGRDVVVDLDVYADAAGGRP